MRPRSHSRQHGLFGHRILFSLVMHLLLYLTRLIEWNRVTVRLDGLVGPDASLQDPNMCQREIWIYSPAVRNWVGERQGDTSTNNTHKQNSSTTVGKSPSELPHSLLLSLIRSAKLRTASMAQSQGNWCWRAENCESWLGFVLKLSSGQKQRSYVRQEIS